MFGISIHDISVAQINRYILNDFNNFYENQKNHFMFLLISIAYFFSIFKIE